jgi:hypothetical protein
MFLQGRVVVPVLAVVCYERDASLVLCARSASVEVGEREGENTSGNSEMKECWQGYRYDGLTPSQAWVVIRPCISVCVCFCCWTAVDATMLIDAQIPFCSTSAVSWANCFSL